MLVQSAFDIQFELDKPTPIVAMLHLHPSLAPYVRAGDQLLVEHELPGIASGFGRRLAISGYADSFGNRCSRLLAPAGRLRLSGSNLVEIEEAPDPAAPDAQQVPIQKLPSEVLQFLLPSRVHEPIATARAADLNVGTSHRRHKRDAAALWLTPR